MLIDDSLYGVGPDFGEVIGNSRLIRGCSDNLSSSLHRTCRLWSTMSFHHIVNSTYANIVQISHTL